MSVVEITLFEGQIGQNGWNYTTKQSWVHGSEMRKSCFFWKVQFRGGGGGEEPWTPCLLGEGPPDLWLVIPYDPSPALSLTPKIRP